jgi:hypothetical protein
MRVRRFCLYCLAYCSIAIAALILLLSVAGVVLWLQHLYVNGFWRFPWE